MAGFYTGWFGTGTADDCTLVGYYDNSRMILQLSCIYIDPVVTQNGANKFGVRIELTDEHKSIGDLKTSVVTKIHEQKLLPTIEHVKVDFIVAGKYLLDSSQLARLDVGPATQIHALIRPVAAPHNGTVKSVPNQSTDSLQSQSSNEEWKPRFFVFCKRPCGRMRKGRLRVKCSVCESNAVLLETEPGCWEDVLTKPSRLDCKCLELGCVDAKAVFYFRCVECSDKGESSNCVPLPQLKSNAKRSECAICEDVYRRVVDFGCSIDEESCSLCLACFKEYATISLNERRFVMKAAAGLGYTLACATPQCDGVIRDSHHFYLVGQQFYDKYQSQATELVLLGERGIYCPRPECATGFILDGDHGDTGQLVVCPECGHSLCRHCGSPSAHCACDEHDTQDTDEQKNTAERQSSSTGGATTSAATVKRRSRESREAQARLVTIKATCKQCPRCRTNTERNGGCSHITCRQCAFDWCWICETEWTDECQWSHWFD